MKRLSAYILFIMLSASYFLAEGQIPIQYTGFAIDSQTGNEMLSYQSFYQYDSQGRLRVYTNYNYSDEQQKLLPTYRAETNYDDEGRQIYNKTITYKNNTDTISSERTFINVYRPDGLQSEYTITEKYLDDPNEYKYGFKYTYSDNGCVERMDQYSQTNNVTGNGYYINYTRDAQCRILLSQLYPLFPGLSPSFDRYEYNGNNLVAQRSYFITDGDTTQQSEYLFTYNDKNQLLVQQMTDYWKTEYEYDGIGRVIFQRTFYWNNQGQQWAISGEFLYEYDTNGRIVFQRGDYAGFSYTQEFEYNSEGKNTRTVTTYIITSQGFIQFMNETRNYFRCDGAADYSEQYDLNSGSPKLVSKVKIQYATKADCEPGKEQPLTIFPNPTLGPVKLFTDTPLDAYELKVYNTAGQLIHQQTINDPLIPMLFDFSALPNGTYIVTVSGNSYYASSRLVKN